MVNVSDNGNVTNFVVLSAVLHRASIAQIGRYAQFARALDKQAIAKARTVLTPLDSIRSKYRSGCTSVLFEAAKLNEY